MVPSISKLTSAIGSGRYHDPLGGPEGNSRVASRGLRESAEGWQSTWGANADRATQQLQSSVSESVTETGMVTRSR
jgi:hypothetical protein